MPRLPWDCLGAKDHLCIQILGLDSSGAQCAGQGAPIGWSVTQSVPAVLALFPLLAGCRGERPLCSYTTGTDA